MPRRTSTRRSQRREAPRRRLRTAFNKARIALEEVDAPGFHRIPERVNAAVNSVRPLVEIMESVARTGLRPLARSADRVAGTDVATAVCAVHEALAALIESSASTQSARYEALVVALNQLSALAESAIEHGIAGTGASDPNDPWKAFSG